MLTKFYKSLKRILRKSGSEVITSNGSIHHFHSTDYLRHTARRLEHLASLRIPVARMSVLDVGAGIGDHSHFYIDRECQITITDARPENLSYLRSVYPDKNIQSLDMESPSHIEGTPFDVVHCYGLLYHLGKPQQALEFLAQNTKGILFLETCVSFGEDEKTNLVSEVKFNPTQAHSGTGCRPTRSWIFKELRKLFEYVYLPLTQPCHEEFPLDWSAPAKHAAPLQRAVFIASRYALQNELLTENLVVQQIRH